MALHRSTPSVAPGVGGGRSNVRGLWSRLRCSNLSNRSRLPGSAVSSLLFNVSTRSSPSFPNDGGNFHKLLWFNLSTSNNLILSIFTGISSRELWDRSNARRCFKFTNVLGRLPRPLCANVRRRRLGTYLVKSLGSSINRFLLMSNSCNCGVLLILLFALSCSKRFPRKSAFRNRGNCLKILVGHKVSRLSEASNSTKSIVSKSFGTKTIF
mmetsp:Transcript_11390/g.27685  ORF Transcript_11390/g.27685 Transcript_11390/m.27685 type:complete len:211 (-) Transcript_11390:848-1480(-)